jgi:hypothetical protein
VADTKFSWFMEMLFIENQLLSEVPKPMFSILIFSQAVITTVRREDSMRKRMFVVLLIASIMIIGGCSNKYSKTTRTRQIGIDNTKSKQASKLFRLGKTKYLNCNFSESIKYLKNAISYEPISIKKAEYYIYLGATYFYLRDVSSAKNCFSQAKRCSRKIKPSCSEFPGEIIRLYEAVH